MENNYCDEDMCICCMFPSENSVAVGYAKWLLDVELSENFAQLKSIIAEKKLVMMKWPSNAEVCPPKKMGKLKNIVWNNIDTIVCAYGSWVEMCQAAKNLENREKAFIEKTERKKYKRKTSITSEDDNIPNEITKKTHSIATANKKFKEGNERKHNMEILQKCKTITRTVCSSDSEGEEDNFTTLSKTELIAKIHILKIDIRRLKKKLKSSSASHHHELLKEIERGNSTIKKYVKDILQILKLDNEERPEKLKSYSSHRHALPKETKIDNASTVKDDVVAIKDDNILDDDNTKPEVTHSSIQYKNIDGEYFPSFHTNDAADELVETNMVADDDVLKEEWRKKLNHCNRINLSKAINDAMTALFSKEEMRNGLLIGRQPTKYAGIDIDAEATNKKRKLDPIRLHLIYEFTEKYFAGEARRAEIVKKKITQKLNNEARKLTPIM